MRTNQFHFTITRTQNRARAGTMETAHGSVETPAFMPVATQGSVKGLTPQEVHDLGTSILLSNTYHLYLRPGIDHIEEAGGLHKFMGWNWPILTDSGGFQIFSMGSRNQINDNEVTFRSHIDGSFHKFTPEDAVRYQERLGVDIMMPLDHCISTNADISSIKQAMDRTHRWAIRCRDTWHSPKQALFGIIQGGLSEHFRAQSCEFITNLDYSGYAIGGLAVGEPKEEMNRIVSYVDGLLPRNKPRYLMGVGSPEDLINGVARGIDLFDCALPTRVARNGALFTPVGRVDITAPRFKKDNGPLVCNCDCYTCTNFSTSYLHHLFKSKELLALRLGSIHNLRFIQKLMYNMRSWIVDGHFERNSLEFLNTYKPTKENVRISQKELWIKTREKS